MTLVSQVGSCVVAGLTLLYTVVLLTGGVIKVVVNNLPGCATLLWMHPGAGPIVYNNQHREVRGGSGGVLYPFQLVIFDHLRPTCPTDAHMHMCMHMCM